MIPILAENDSVILCEKTAGVLSQPSPNQKESMLSLLEAQCRCAVYPIHRLDREVGGAMVFAKTASSAAVLSAAVQQRTLQKEYLAIVQGRPEEAEGIFKDLLFKDSARGKTFVVTRMRKGVKEASLSYRLLAEREGRSLVWVRLHTGRTHQIRVQFSSRGMPLIGDRKYGGLPASGTALWSFRLSFPGGKGVPSFTVSSLPSGELWLAFQDVLADLTL